MSVRRLKLCLVCLSLFLAAIAGSADQFRALVVERMELDTRPELVLSMEIRADETAIIDIAGETQFLEGVLVEILLSDILKRYSEGFALTVYADIDPAPAKGMGQYEGREVFFSVLPFASRIRLGIPVEATNRERFGPEEELFGLTDAVRAARFPVLLAVQSISKGLPADALTRNFFLTAQPLVEDKGLVRLALLRPEGFEDAAAELLLDDEPLVDLSDAVEVAAGVHTIQVRSEVFKPLTTTFSLPAAQSIELELPLEPSVSYVTLEGLEGAVAYLDGEKVELLPGERKQLTEGEHTIRFKIERYSVTKKFTVEAGNDYTISLNLEIQVRQDL